MIRTNDIHVVSHVAIVTQVQILEEWDMYFPGVNIQIRPVVPSTAQVFPMWPVATAKTQEDGQCHNHGLGMLKQLKQWANTPDVNGCHDSSTL